MGATLEERDVGMPMKLRRKELKHKREKNKRAPHPNLHPNPPKRSLLQKDRGDIYDWFLELDSEREFCRARTQQLSSINIHFETSMTQGPIN